MWLAVSALRRWMWWQRRQRGGQRGGGGGGEGCARSFWSVRRNVRGNVEDYKRCSFFLRTAFGDSKTAAGMQIEIKTQGLCQGNGTAPAGWAVVSIVILRAH
jgi:hypothetical protein